MYLFMYICIYICKNLPSVIKTQCCLVQSNKITEKTNSVNKKIYGLYMTGVKLIIVFQDLVCVRVPRENFPFKTKQKYNKNTDLKINSNKDSNDDKNDY